MPGIIGSRIKIMTQSYADPSIHEASAYSVSTTGGRWSHTHKRISWAAIFGGVILVVIIQIMLSTLGTGIGLGAINIGDGTTQNANALGLGAGIWWIVSGIVSLAFGGFVSAWLAGIEMRWDGILHGLITWGIATLLTVYLLTTAAGGIIGGGFSAVGSVVSMAGNSVKEAAQPLAQAAGVSPDMLQQQAQSYLRPTNTDPATMSPQDAQKEVARNLVTYASGGTDAAAAKDRVIAIMAAQRHISHDDAAKQFDEGQAKLARARDKTIQAAKEAADANASAISKASFAAFGALLLGAIAATIGGSLAVQRRAYIANRVVR